MGTYYDKIIERKLKGRKQLFNLSSLCIGSCRQKFMFLLSLMFFVLIMDFITHQKKQQAGICIEKMFRFTTS